MKVTKIDNPPNVPYPVKKVSAGIACAQNVRAEVRSGHRHKHLTISKYELLIAIMSFSGVLILVCRSLLYNFYGRSMSEFPETPKLSPEIRNRENSKSWNPEIQKHRDPEIPKFRNP